MRKTSDFSGLSDLEREIELEMDDELETEEEPESNDELELDDELETDEETDESELELAFETDDESDFEQEAQADEEAGVEDETDEELEVKVGGDDRNQEYVERFLEIASHEFESESEVDRMMNETLNDVASEYLFGSLKRLGKGLKGLAKNRIVRSLVKKGLSVASGQLPALKAAMQLAKGNLQGARSSISASRRERLPFRAALLHLVLCSPSASRHRRIRRPIVKHGRTMCRFPVRRSNSSGKMLRRRRTNQWRRANWPPSPCSMPLGRTAASNLAIRSAGRNETGRHPSWRSGDAVQDRSG